MIPLLLADENFDFPVVAKLKEKGYDVITLVDLNLVNLGIPDEEVLKLATQLHRAVITINRRDFIKLHRANDEHAGIIVCTRNPNIEEFAQAVHETLAAHSEFKGQLLRVYRPS